MSQSHDVYRGVEPIGGRQHKSGGTRRFEIKAKDFTQTEQGVPLNLIYGMPKPFSGGQLTPIFGFRSEAIESKVGKKSNVTTGYRYWGSYAIGICYGRTYDLIGIYNGDTEIWDGSINHQSADADGMTLLNTSIGAIRFYWGTATQNVDDLLSNLIIDFEDGNGPVSVPMPANRHMCYAVADDIYFGEQVAPPVLRFHLGRRLSLLDISTHQLSNDAVIPEVIYDLMTNGLYGLGIATGDINTASFVAAAETVIDEDLGASPVQDNQESAREFIGRLLSYIDGFIYWNGGQFHMTLNRVADVSGAPTLTISDMTEEPTGEAPQFDSTWNRTIVTFQDKENEWEETGEPYDDQANFAITGRKKSEIKSYPWITRRSVAKTLARHIGQKAGVPSATLDLELLPSFKTLTTGQLVRVFYPKLSIIHDVYRIKSKSVGGPSDPAVTLKLFSERNRDIANDFVPTGDRTFVPPQLDQTGSGNFNVTDTVPRLSWLPDALKDGTTDGLLVAMNRPSTVVSSAEVYWTWNPALQPYRLLAEFTNFPAKATLLSWHRIRATSWLCRIAMDSALDYDRLQLLKEEANAVYAVSGVREFITAPPKDEHQVLSPWLEYVQGGIFEMISATVIDIELVGARFGTLDLMLETVADEGRYPTAHIYFGRQEDFAIFPTNQIAFEVNNGNAVDDSGKIRYVKTPVGNFRHQQTIDDVTATTFDRDDVTMSPDGTLSRDWGARVPTTYETADIEFGARLELAEGPDYAALVEEYDEILGKIYDGSATAEETLLAEDIDDTLGAMVASGSDIYNEAP